MNREERERTKAGWKRPRRAGLKVGDKLVVKSCNNLMYQKGMNEGSIVTFRAIVVHNGNDIRYQIDELPFPHAIFSWRFERV